MAIVIMGILAVLAIPRFDSFNAIKLDGAVKKTLSDIRYAQQLAIARHEEYAVGFNSADETYRIFRLVDNSPAQDPFSRQFLDPWLNFTTDSKYRGINIASVNLGGTQTLRFDWQGIPKNAAGVNLSVEGLINLTYQNNSRNIYITPNTGRVRTD